MLSTSTRRLAAAAAFLASTAAALSAVGAHVLAQRLSAAELASFDTAVAFQFVNAIGLFAFAWLGETLPAPGRVRACGWLLLAGVLLFCGSIYAARFGLAANPGPLAPAGGSAIIAAWAGLGIVLLRRRN